jgi:ribosomal protein S18 acetylase RimI-like enzyme
MATNTNLTFRPPCKGESLTEIARWIWQDHSDFYSIFFRYDTEAVICIEKLLRDISSDLIPPMLAVAENQPVGVMCFFPLTELAARNLASLRLLMSQADDMKTATQKGRGFSSQVPPISGSSLYLARIAVAEHAQNKGIGSALLQEFEGQALAAGFQRVCMHVRKNNGKAIRFYNKHAYNLCSSSDMLYVALEKHLGN